MNQTSKGLIVLALLCSLLAACGGGSGSGGSQQGSGNPSPGGTPPTILSITPGTTNASGPGFYLTVFGTGFDKGPSPTDGGTRVMLDGVMMQTDYVSGTEVFTQLGGSIALSAGMHQISVLNTTNGANLASNTVELQVLPALTSPVVAPIITSFDPGSVDVGSQDFTLTVTGSDFIGMTTVYWNGNPMPTTYVSDTELLAQIPAALLTAVASPSVFASDPIVSLNPGRGNAVPFPVGYSVTVLDQPANDMVWDPVNQVIYLSVPASAAANPGTIATLDPVSGTVLSYTPVAGGPDKLAISDDSAYLYAGLDSASAVARFTLPAMAPDIQASLGIDSFGSVGYCADSLAVAPGAPHTFAVALATESSAGCSFDSRGGIVIYDDSTPRATIAAGPDDGGGLHPNLTDSLAWGSDASTLYALGNESIDNSTFDELSVDAGGVSLSTQYTEGVEYQSSIHYDAGTGLVYADQGEAFDPADGTASDFITSALQLEFVYGMVPDSGLGRAYFADATQAEVNSDTFALQSFDLDTQALVDSITLPPSVTFSFNVHLKVIRWGTDGLALLTPTQVVLISGHFVTD